MRSVVFAVACVTLVIGANLWFFQATQPSSERVQRQTEATNLDWVPPADSRLYEHAQDFKDWKNPYITVGPSQIVIIAEGVRTTVPVEKLGDALRSLPRSAWSYGRVVAVQAGGGAMRPGDEPRVEMNRVQVEAILRALRVEIEYWPGA